MNVPYDSSFYADQAPLSLLSARAVLEILFRTYTPESLIDVGCGVGTWARAAKDLGVRHAIGVDGSHVERDALLIEPCEFLAVDLERDRLAGLLTLGGKQRFDLVISMEVAEHLTYKRAATFVADLTELGNIVLFSAAIPFQGGEHHRNEQWPEFWAILFRGRGYTCHDIIRRHVWDRQDVSWWYAQNSFVFVKSDCEVAKLFTEQAAPASALSIVHPQNYLDQILKWCHTYRSAAGSEEYVDYRTLATAYSVGANQLPALQAPARALASPERPDVFPNTRVARRDPDDELQRLAADLDHVRTELEEKSRLCADLQVEWERAQMEIGSLLSQNANLIDSNLKLSESSVGLARAYDLLSQRLNDAEATNMSLAADLSELSQKFAAVCDTEEPDRARADALVTELALLKQEAGTLREELSALRGERDQLSEETQYYQTRYKILSTKYHELRRSRFVRLAEAYYRLYTAPVTGPVLSTLRRAAVAALRRRRAAASVGETGSADPTPGSPAASGLQIAHPVVKASAPFVACETVNRILIVKLDHIGDFVLGLPAFDLLRQSFPDAHITLLCGRWNRAIAETSGCFDRVECLSLLPEVSGGHDGKRMQVDREAVTRLQLPAFDIAIDFRDHLDTHQVLGAVDARFRAAFYARETASMMDLTIPSTSWRLLPTDRVHHQILLSLLAAAVVAIHTGKRVMHDVLDRVTRSTEAVALSDRRDGPLIGVNVGSGMVEKNWPLERYAELGNHLVKKLGATFVIFGSQREAEASATLAFRLPARSVVDLSGKLPLLQSVATMRQLDLYIGNDTGTTHIAAALGVPTVCLFGTATSFDSHGVLGTRCVSLLAAPSGMRSIEVKDAMVAVERLLQANGHAAADDATLSPPPAVEGGKPASWGPLGLVVIDNKPFASDFRKYLMGAAITAGGDAVHVCCWAEAIVTHRGERVDTTAFTHELDKVADRIIELLGHRRFIILVGLGTDRAYAPLVRRLRSRPNAETVLYDVFDYFRYGTRGRALLNYLRVDLFWRREVDRAMLLERGLRPIYPRSWTLENASHMRRLSGPATASSKRVIYIGSIDSRVDFEWLKLFAAQDVMLDIYGRLHDAEPEIEGLLRGFLEGRPNVRFLDCYDNDELPRILGNYRIGILPYKRMHTMTRHISPDKVYHYLNAGLEVIASDIPQTRRLAYAIHLVGRLTDIPSALTAAQNEPRIGRWSVDDNTWDRRWAELQAMIAECASADAKTVANGLTHPS
jgi:ADP-heptose:LPS heptosyltransferase